MDGVEEHRGWRHPAVTVPAVLGLLAVVALATARHSWSQSSSGSRHLPTGFWDWVVSVLLVLWLGACVLAWREFLQLRRGHAAIGPVSWRKAALVLGLILLFTLLLARVGHHEPSGHGGAPPSEPPPPDTALGGQESPRPAPRSGHFRWEGAAGTAALLAALGGGYLLLHRRRRVRPADRGAAAAALIELLDETLDDLRREPDPRRAVIAAYARMERSLAATGLPRHPSEAPEEYLERVLVELDASRASVRRLTELFARAKFSPHAIGAPMKDDAIDALVALRAELAEPSE